jgi:hypothetical protein
LILFSAALACVGCSQRPAPVPLPDFDPPTAGKAAIIDYDTDGDQALAGDELDRVPGIKKSLAAFDVNVDGKVTAEEIAARLQQTFDQKLGLCPPFGCRVLLDGRPLVGATVRFVPEAFLGGTTKLASGVTDQQGIARVQVAQEELPSKLKGIRGIQPGIFKVEITHPQFDIPAIYNTQTIFGQEISNESILLRMDDTVFQITTP